MRNKTFTILVSSNDRGKTRSLIISSAWLKTFVALGCVMAIVFSAAALDYVGLLLQSTENKRLKAESAQLKRQFSVVESKVSTLEKSLERVKNFSKKLRLITNVEDEDRNLRLSVRPGLVDEAKSFAATAPDEDTRGPANIVSSTNSDSLFLERPPLDAASGELSRSDIRGYATLSIRIDEAAKKTQLTEVSVLELYDALKERESLLLATPSISPIENGWASSEFGYRLDPFTGRTNMHSGIDLPAPPGKAVRTPADGVVSYVGYEQGYGKIVSIDHGFGVVTRYAHNSQLFVELGQKIKRRDVIAAVGSTGRSSGPHVHYEVRIHGVPVDPRNYMLDLN